QFAAYFTIASGAWLLAVLLIKPSNVFDLSRCVGWYLLVFLLTYILRPAGSQLVGDTFMYDLLQTGTFEQHWYLMAIAAPLAILSVSIGYRLGPTANVAENTSTRPAIIADKSARVLVYILLFWGYIITLRTLNDSGASQDDVAGASNIGVFEHSSAWVESGDVFVSAGRGL